MTMNVQQPLVTPVTNPSHLSSSNPTTLASTSAVQNKTNKSPAQERLVCSLCNKVYRSSAGLRYHKRKRHRGK